MVSILAKFFAVTGIVCNISDMQANGCTDLSTNELRRVKSVTILTFLPSGLTTKMQGSTTLLVRGIG